MTDTDTDTDDGDDGEPLPTYERQAGKQPDGADIGRVACFNDVHNSATWRPPTTEEFRLIQDEFTQPIESAHVAVIDGYQSDGPGFAGPLAVLVGGDPGTTRTIPLDGKYE